MIQSDLKTLTNDEKGFYLMLCGWNCVKSAVDNEYWHGDDAWIKGHSIYFHLDQAYGLERFNNGIVE